MRILLPFILLAASPAAAAAQDWRVVAIDDETARGASVAYADVSTIARSGDEVRFVMQIRFSSPRDGHDALRGQMRIQCAARRWGADSTALYRGEERGEEQGPAELEEVRPGTNAAIVLDNVCAGRFLTGPVDPAAHSQGLFGAR